MGKRCMKAIKSSWRLRMPNYCVVCGEWLGPDDYDGLCGNCPDECDTCLGNMGKYYVELTTPDGLRIEIVGLCEDCNGTGLATEAK